ncbi:hypothetical protein [Paraburkholderia sp. J67]|uniref:TetR/AcrR family transcriptional regulator n=1 Tax=Paraburkholderia sp. J67 TaxID=2805435 RepID=UPI002ABDBD3E|nr:hypothetical protein [Paraburkholderia sp. J67]
MNATTKSPRETAKQLRREAIFEAAERLIRRSGSTDFSMQDLAHAAGLSLATTYNLIGPKATVLYALLNLRADSIRHVPERLHESGDPLGVVMTSARCAVQRYTGDPDFYRPLMRFLLGVPDPVHHPAFMARGLEYWRAVMCPIGASGRSSLDVSADELATFVHVFFTGALSMWVQAHYDENRFLSELERYLALLLRSLR